MASKRQDLKKPTNKELLARERSIIPYSNSAGDIKFHLTYPNTYWVAMSNLGFQAVFDILAQDSRVSIERGFLPDDISDEKESKWRTFESSRLLGDCDILGFSLSFETDYPHLVKMLLNQGVLFSDGAARTKFADENTKFQIPLIIAGGTAITLNPEPVADFIDVMVLGEAEELLPEFVAAYAEAKQQNMTREETLRLLSKIEGVYIPQFYKPVFNSDDTVARYEKLFSEAPDRPQRRFVKDLSKFGTYSRIISPDTEFKSMFLTETGRGCEMGCRFCVAGYIYRPIRKRSEEKIMETIQIGLKNSNAVGFVGAAVSSHKSIAKLAKVVSDSGARASLSSIMSQKVSKELAASITESEYKTVALAPEAGSSRLRRAAGKRVTNDQVVTAAGDLAEAGIKGFKLYFIVGLPTEEDADIDALADLTIAIRDKVVEISRSTGQVAWVALSVNPFIPKASTPFQWEPMLDPKTLDKKIDRIRERIKKVPNIELRFEPPKESYFQGLLSRGDRRVSKLLHELEKRSENWKWLIKNTDKRILPDVPPIDFYVSRRFAFTELLPWEVVDSRVERSLLRREALRAHFGEDYKEESAGEYSAPSEVAIAV